jgi:ribosomal protein S12 methylthiotransferase
MPAKVGLISLGCAKNLVDSEIMLGHLRSAGMDLTSDSADADVLIVNTCAFIDSAKTESIQAILEAHRDRGLQRRRKGQRLIVAGCMSQRFSTELSGEMPEVDAFIGLDQLEEVAPVVRRVLARAPDAPPEDLVPEHLPVYIPDFNTPRWRLTPKHYAYVKIAEGCNHPCS